MTRPKFLILGAGATGLGAAHRLHQLGQADFLILEQNDYPGGLAASFTDPSGFVWDLGGHIQFSHYEYFDRLMDEALGADWLHHRRESFVWIHGRFVPYPLQSNLRYLPRQVMAECVLGLLRAARNNHRPPAHFSEWIRASFGEGIARHFLLPYNAKVWAHPLEMMSYSWIGERVATVNLEKVLENLLLEKDEARWGPNEHFRFPLRGGTGAVWRAVAGMLPAGVVRYGERVVSIDPAARLARTAAGSYPYDYLISTIPLDRLALLVDDPALVEATSRLRYSTTHVLGVGFQGRPPESLRRKCWMYFPESDCPFYRVTLFSNYSPHNVPDSERCWSLMAEVSESPFQPVDRGRLIESTLQGFYRTGLAAPTDEVVSTWSRSAEHGYPIPTRDRDDILEAVHSSLEPRGIFSRGRFGGWKYEVANQDHSSMQGVEVVERLLLGLPEMTYPNPPSVNNHTGRVPIRHPG